MTNKVSGKVRLDTVATVSAAIAWSEWNTWFAYCNKHGRISMAHLIRLAVRKFLAEEKEAGND